MQQARVSIRRDVICDVELHMHLESSSEIYEVRTAPSSVVPRWELHIRIIGQVLRVPCCTQVIVEYCRHVEAAVRASIRTRQ